MHLPPVAPGLHHQQSNLSPLNGGQPDPPSPANLQRLPRQRIPDPPATAATPSAPVAPTSFLPQRPRHGRSPGIIPTQQFVPRTAVPRIPLSSQVYRPAALPPVLSSTSSPAQRPVGADVAIGQLPRLIARSRTAVPPGYVVEGKSATAVLPGHLFDPRVGQQRAEGEVGLAAHPSLRFVTLLRSPAHPAKFGQRRPTDGRTGKSARCSGCSRNMW